MNSTNRLPTRQFISEGLTQVWAWKDDIHREVAHLPAKEALRMIQEKARVVAARYPQFRRSPSEPVATVHSDGL